MGTPVHGGDLTYRGRSDLLMDVAYRTDMCKSVWSEVIEPMRVVAIEHHQSSGASLRENGK
jgi:hypothetical protein